MSPSIGSQILVNIGTEEEPVLRPAVVVRLWTGTTINAVAFLDGTNDERHVKARGYSIEPDGRHGTTWWLTSISQGTGPLAWRHPSPDDTVTGV